MTTFELTEEAVTQRWREYAEAFSRKDHQALCDYLDPDLCFIRGDGMTPWRTRQELLDFHGPEGCWKYFNETLRPISIEFLQIPARDAELELCYFIGTLEIYAEVFADWSDPPHGYEPLSAGDTARMRDRLIYAMNSAGRIVLISSLSTVFIYEPSRSTL